MIHKAIDTFVSSGTFTAPSDGVYTFFGIGAGGGGTQNTGGGGGGGSSWVSQYMTEGQTATITVGTSAENTNGSDTTVVYSSSVILRAKGGLRGGGGGTGGQAADGVGSTKYSGGNATLGTGSRAGGGGAGTQQSGSGHLGGDYFGGVSNSSYIAVNRFYGSGGGSAITVGVTGRSGVVFVYYNEQIEDFPVVLDRAYTRFEGTSNVINLPTTTAGDLLIAFISSNSTSTRTYTTTGWTKFEQANSGTEEVRGIVCYKVATGSDSLTLEISSTEIGTAIVYNVKNAEFVNLASVGGNSTNADPPNLNIGSTKNCLWIACIMRDLNAQNADVTASPTNYKDFEYLTPQNNVNGSDIAIAIRWLRSSAEDPSAFTSTNTSWAAFTVALGLNQKRKQQIIML